MLRNLGFIYLSITKYLKTFVLLIFKDFENILYLHVFSMKGLI